MLIQWPGKKKKSGKIKGNNISSSDTQIRSMGIDTGMQFFHFTLMPATNDLMQKKTLNSQVCTMNYIVNVNSFFFSQFRSNEHMHKIVILVKIRPMWFPNTFLLNDVEQAVALHVVITRYQN